MTESYQTPPSLVNAEQQLSEALDKLKQNLDGVEALSGIASAFSEASDANKTTVAAFLEASSSFEKSSSVISTSLESLAQSMEENQRKFSETLSGIREELSSQTGKINLLMFLAIIPIALIVLLLVLR